MIRRLRAAVPAMILSGVAVGAALTVFAQAVRPPEYPTVGEMHRFVVWAFLSGAGVVIGGIAVAYAWDQRRRDTLAGVIQTENARQIAELSGVVRKHHDDWAMHPTGSAHRIDIFEQKLDNTNIMLNGIQTATLSLVDGQRRAAQDLEKQEERLREVEDILGTLHAEHNVMHGMTLRRDPMASPNKRRSTDPHEGGENGSGDDHRPQRGPKS